MCLWDSRTWRPNKRIFGLRASSINAFEGMISFWLAALYITTTLTYKHSPFYKITVKIVVSTILGCVKKNERTKTHWSNRSISKFSSDIADCCLLQHLICDWDDSSCLSLSQWKPNSYDFHGSDPILPGTYSGNPIPSQTIIQAIPKVSVCLTIYWERKNVTTRKLSKVGSRCVFSLSQKNLSPTLSLSPLVPHKFYCTLEILLWLRRYSCLSRIEIIAIPFFEEVFFEALKLLESPIPILSHIPVSWNKIDSMLTYGKNMITVTN